MHTSPMEPKNREICVANFYRDYLEDYLQPCVEYLHLRGDCIRSLLSWSVSPDGFSEGRGMLPCMPLIITCNVHVLET